jgi:D-tyrosyl-tRNA(Tyr) deacylase
MRVVIQRVSEASVSINQQVFSSIKSGLLILVGIETEDTFEDAEWLAKKITSLRIFSDLDGKMNLDIKQINADVLLISQFTLFAQTKKGNRPSYIRSARPEHAIPIYEKLIQLITNELGKKIHTGKFGADMKVMLLNDGPLTIIIDTKNKE